MIVKVLLKNGTLKAIDLETIDMDKLFELIKNCERIEFSSLETMMNDEKIKRIIREVVKKGILLIPEKCDNVWRVYLS